MERLIIDTDPGVDDAHAIMMASAHPGVKIEAITVVAGNVGLGRTVANSCTILDVMGDSAPVFPGCSQALVPGADDASDVHGSDGLGDAQFGPSPRAVEAEHASAAIVRLARETPGELSLIAIGPLTNVAVALKLDPELPSHLKRLVFMGGAVHARGNTANFTAEFNAYADPEAAHIVFAAFPKLELVSWEATLDHGIPLPVAASWKEYDNERARFFSRISGGIFQWATVRDRDPRFFAADGLAMAVALEPDIVKDIETRYVTVELDGRHTRGQTTVDWSDHSGEPANVDIVMAVDQGRFEALMASAVA